MSRKNLLLSLILGAVMILAAGVVYATTCNSYSNSRIVAYGNGYYCALTGNGCTECYNDDGGSCVTNGDSCTPKPFYDTPW